MLKGIFKYLIVWFQPTILYLNLNSKLIISEGLQRDNALSKSMLLPTKAGIYILISILQTAYSLHLILCIVWNFDVITNNLDEYVDFHGDSYCPTSLHLKVTVLLTNNATPIVTYKKDTFYLFNSLSHKNPIQTSNTFFHVKFQKHYGFLYSWMTPTIFFQEKNHIFLGQINIYSVMCIIALDNYSNQASKWKLKNVIFNQKKSCLSILQNINITYYILI